MTMGSLFWLQEFLVLGIDYGIIHIFLGVGPAFGQLEGIVDWFDELNVTNEI